MTDQIPSRDIDIVTTPLVFWDQNQNIKFESEIQDKTKMFETKIKFTTKIMLLVMTFHGRKSRLQNVWICRTVNAGCFQLV